MRDAERTWRAELADMPQNIIEAWVIERGGVIVDRAWYRRAMQVLLSSPGWPPPGEPPLAEDDLPFEVE